MQAVDKTKAGVLIGSGMGGLTVFQDGVKNMVEKSHKKISPFFIPYAITNMCASPATDDCAVGFACSYSRPHKRRRHGPANGMAAVVMVCAGVHTACRTKASAMGTLLPPQPQMCACRGSALVAIELGWMGPNYSISTACATANYAFVAAANHIRKGDADIMIAGGSEAAIIPVGLGGFVACRQVALACGDLLLAPAQCQGDSCECSCFSSSGQALGVCVCA